MPAARLILLKAALLINIIIIIIIYYYHHHYVVQWSMPPNFTDYTVKGMSRSARHHGLNDLTGRALSKYNICEVMEHLVYTKVR